MHQLNDRDRRVLFGIINHKAEYDTTPTVRELARELDSSTATVQKAITSLIKQGFISCPTTNGRRKAHSIKVLIVPTEENNDDQE